MSSGPSVCLLSCPSQTTESLGTQLGPYEMREDLGSPRNPSSWEQHQLKGV